MSQPLGTADRLAVALQNRQLKRLQVDRVDISLCQGSHDIAHHRPYPFRLAQTRRAGDQQMPGPVTKLCRTGTGQRPEEPGLCQSGIVFEMNKVVQTEPARIRFQAIIRLQRRDDITEYGTARAVVVRDPPGQMAGHLQHLVQAQRDVDLDLHDSTAIQVRVRHQGHRHRTRGLAQQKTDRSHQPSEVQITPQSGTLVEEPEGPQTDRQFQDRPLRYRETC